ncbi:MAG: ABC transporter permease [SAR116 cluster bacterium]|nr:MAG: ABC transporter permease [SAR116 cluster bacterium]|tara:strand:+ start:190 stop:1008 length:819 start_codon:yes stop_codon:yes gene_type:complete
MSWWQKAASETQVTHRQRVWLYILATIIMFLLVIPTVIVIPMSFSESQYLEFPPREWSLRWYQEYLNTPRWVNATITSFKVATLTMLVATPFGTMAAYGLFVSGGRMSKMLFFTLMTPMIVPVILIAIGTFYVFGRIGLVNSIFGLVMAHTVLSVPIVMIIVTSALRTYDLNQERVAQSLGSTRIRAFFEITLPQLKFSIVTAALLAFLTSFDEVIISIFLSGGGNSTLTKQMFSALRDYIDPTIAAISTLMILLSTGLMLGLQILGGRGAR